MNSLFFLLKYAHSCVSWCTLSASVLFIVIRHARVQPLTQVVLRFGLRRPLPPTIGIGVQCDFMLYACELRMY
jgi:hypothetical protein